MKFTVKKSDVARGLEAALACSVTGVKREYPDAGRITIQATKDGLKSFTNNGNVAVTNEQSGGDTYKFEVAGTITVKSDDFRNSLESFDGDDILSFEVSNTELTICLVRDPEVLQALPSEVRDITMPAVAEKFDKEVLVPKETLLACLKKVTFAMGIEKFRPEFLYWVLRLGQGKLRAVCGDGARIAIYELDGDNLCDNKKPLDVAIHKDHNPVLEKIISLIGDENVKVQEYARNGEDDPLTSQTIVSGTGLSMVFIGHDPGVKWPDENRFLDKVRNFHFTLRTGELAQALKGISATYNQDVRKNNDLHWATLTFDLKKKVLSIKAEHTMRANRKVNLADADGPEDTMEFKCLTTYFNDAVRNGDNEGMVQIEFPNGNGPAYFRYNAADSINKDAPLTRSNVSAGTKEQYTVFFASFNKKK